MSKALHKAAQLEERLSKLAGPEWDSDEEDDDNQMNASDEDSGDDQGPTKRGKKDSADFVALSAAVKKRLGGKGEKGKKAVGKPETSSVIYLGHIPHGFYEKQMTGFFSQFGEIARLRLSRSKKTARSRGYAFIEFEEPEVAQIVAETMDGYYLDGRKLVSSVVEPEKIHQRTFEGADRKFRVIPWRKLERERRAAPKTEDDARKCLGRLVKGENKKKRKLASLGIDYDFPGYKGMLDQAYVNKHGLNRKAKKKLQAAGKEEGGNGEIAAAVLPTTKKASSKKTQADREKGENGEVAAATTTKKALPKAVAPAAVAKERGEKGAAKGGNKRSRPEVEKEEATPAASIAPSKKADADSGQQQQKQKKIKVVNSAEGEKRGKNKEEATTTKKKAVAAAAPPAAAAAAVAGGKKKKVGALPAVKKGKAKQQKKA